MSTRDALLDAAAEVLRTRGLGRTTTKEIARASGFSEATLYKHFDSKEELFVAVLHERVPAFAPLAAALGRKPGSRSVRENLEDVVRAAAAFYVDSFPLSASIYAEPALLAAHRSSLHRRGLGPHKPLEALVTYLTGERDLGRFRADADPAAIAAMLLGAAFQYGFLTSFAGREADAAAIDHLATSAVAGVLIG
ncbi:MAG TPA: helix-turn-helix domain-containing protein [Micromonosporaceae bacterium]|jgi:AcrR family transcriptional regulator